MPTECVHNKVCQCAALAIEARGERHVTHGKEMIQLVLFALEASELKFIIAGGQKAGRSVQGTR